MAVIRPKDLPRVTAVTAGDSVVIDGATMRSVLVTDFLGGQYIESVVTVGAAVALTSGVQTNVTSIPLPAGDWDVSGVVYLLPAATTSVTRYAAGVSTASAVLQTNPGQFVDFTTPAVVTGGTTLNDVIPPTGLACL
jgi:hypothetical protein